MSRRWHLEVTILSASAVFRPNLELRPGYRHLDLVCERPCASGAASENQPQPSLRERPCASGAAPTRMGSVTAQVALTL